MTNILANLKEQVKLLKKNMVALFYASKSREVPVIAKLLAGFTVAYLLSPIDLIPDFIPVLGILDDLILVPLMIRLTIYFIPQKAWLRCKDQAEQHPLSLKKNLSFAIFIVSVWLMAILLLWYYLKS